MRVLIINSVCGIRSTGRICTNLALELEDQGHIVKIVYGRESVPKPYQKYAVRFTSETGIKISALLSRFFDNDGLNSKLSTRRLLKWANQYNPDLLWLHNLHGYYINYEMLFDWIKSRPQMEVKWTLHDCWAFTGHCSHFDFVKCDKWKYLCQKCVQKNRYPKSLFFDNSMKNFTRKKRAFCGVKNLSIITPSFWLADLVKQSFLKDYNVNVIHNTIDESVFKPTQSNFRKNNKLEDKKIVLGVASAWNDRKGLGDFLKLSTILPNNYVIVLVGLSKKQLKVLPKNIIGISRTNTPTELAEIYTSADVFLNLTYEDNYPTVNLESQKCGTPCITYETGGSVESVPKENIVKQGDLDGVLSLVQSICSNVH